MDSAKYSQQVITKTPHFAARWRASKEELEQVARNATDRHAEQGSTLFLECYIVMLARRELIDTLHDLHCFRTKLFAPPH